MKSLSYDGGGTSETHIRLGIVMRLVENVPYVQVDGAVCRRSKYQYGNVAILPTNRDMFDDSREQSSKDELTELLGLQSDNYNFAGNISQ